MADIASSVIDDVVEYLKTLEGLEDACYGGMSDDKIAELTNLNYAGVNRSDTEFPKGNIKEEYAVTIVFETRIPDGFVLNAIEGIVGLGWNFLSDQKITYNYTRLKNSGLILESATFYICKTKRYCLK